MFIYSILLNTVNNARNSYTLSIKATIRSAKQSAKKNQKIICTGVEYTGIKPDQVFALRHLIYQEIVEHPENVI
ncbi:MAG: hypothetical protein KBF68_12065 [Nitrosomonas sp.]|nr:hypothetical protein [Nitrosomonas sp.]